MPQPAIVTYQDVLDHLLDIEGGSSAGRPVKMAKRAVTSGLRMFANLHKWSYYQKSARITVNAAYTTGTITFDYTGGSSERLVTLSGGVFPSWAARGIIRISDVQYEVDQRLSDTTATLTADLNPGADVAAGTSYSLVSDMYQMPTSFVSSDDWRNVSENWRHMEYVSPGEWLMSDRTREAFNVPRKYTFMGDRKVKGATALYLDPPPKSANKYDFIYKSRPAEVKVHQYTTGTVSVSADATAVTGVGTAWDQTHVDTVIRFGDTTNIPTGNGGLYPYIEEARVRTVASATSITLHDAVTQAFSAVKYELSDLIDIEPGAMLDTFLAFCEYRLAILNNETAGAINHKHQFLNEMLITAIEGDRRNTGPGRVSPRSTRLRDSIIYP